MTSDARLQRKLAELTEKFNKMVDAQNTLASTTATLANALNTFIKSHELLATRVGFIERVMGIELADGPTTCDDCGRSSDQATGDPLKDHEPTCKWYGVGGMVGLMKRIRNLELKG